ncbi:sugar transferase [Micromonospora sp. NPDC003197]
MSTPPAMGHDAAATRHAIPVPRRATTDENTAPGKNTAADENTAPGEDGSWRAEPKHGQPIDRLANGIRPGLDTTTVLPYAGSRASTRTRKLRAWMLTAPVDVIALLAPLLLIHQHWRGTLAMAGLTVVIFAAGGLYRARRHVSILDELPNLCGRLLASGALVTIIAALRHESAEYMGDFSRGVGISAALVVLGRALTREATIVARKRRWVEHNTIIIGSGPTAVELARLLRRYPQYGLRFVGFVDVVSRQQATANPLIGTLDQLDQLVKMVDCDVLIIAQPNCPEPVLMEILHRPSSASCDLWAVPRLWGSRSRGDHIGAIPIVRVGDITLSGPQWVLKRASDVVFAAVAMLLLSPVLLLCAIATFLECGRQIFFHQERVGRDGKLFNIIKFRSMHPVDDHEAQTKWSIASDQRVGPVGRFMRRTSLDELPQLWNILRGDMSVVGPRPERPYFVEKFSAEYPTYAMRHRVPVGLTGLAQVSGLRGDTPISDRARFDNYYIENWSLWLDVKVLVRTVLELFRSNDR